MKFLILFFTLALLFFYNANAALSGVYICNGNRAKGGKALVFDYSNTNTVNTTVNRGANNHMEFNGQNITLSFNTIPPTVFMPRSKVPIDETRAGVTGGYLSVFSFDIRYTGYPFSGESTLFTGQELTTSNMGTQVSWTLKNSVLNSAWYASGGCCELNEYLTTDFKCATYTESPILSGYTFNSGNRNFTIGFSYYAVPWSIQFQSRQREEGESDTSARTYDPLKSYNGEFNSTQSMSWLHGKDDTGRGAGNYLYFWSYSFTLSQAAASLPEVILCVFVNTVTDPVCDFFSLAPA